MNIVRCVRTLGIMYGKEDARAIRVRDTHDIERMCIQYRDITRMYYADMNSCANSCTTNTVLPYE